MENQQAAARDASAGGQKAAATGGGQQAASDAAKKVLLEQYELVNKSQEYLGLIVAATLLNYYAVDNQRQQIETLLAGGTAQEQDLYPLQLASATMILSATSFFYGISQDALRQPQESPALEESLVLNDLINSLALFASAIRIYNLFLVRYSPQPQAQTPEEQLEEEVVELEDSEPF